MQKQLLFIIICWLWIMMLQIGNAQQLLGIGGSNLYSIDKEDGVLSLIKSNIGVQHVIDLTYIPKYNRVYGIADYNTVPKLFYFSLCDYTIHVIGEIKLAPDASEKILLAESLTYAADSDILYISASTNIGFRSNIFGNINPLTAYISKISNFSNTLENEADRLCYYDNTLYALDGTGSLASEVYEIDVTNGNAVYINTPYPSLGSFSFDHSGNIYALSTDDFNLYKVNNDFSSTTYCGTLSTTNNEKILAIAFVDNNTLNLENTLVALAGPHILQIDPSTGEGLEIGVLNFSTPATFAYDRHQEKMFVVQQTNSVFVLNELNSCFETFAIDTLKFTDTQLPAMQNEGLAYNYDNQKMYVSAGRSHIWYSEIFCELDITNGQLTPVASISNNVHNEMDELEYADGMFYYTDGTQENTGGFYSFNPYSYISQEIKRPVSPQYSTYAYDMINDILYGIDVDERVLCEVNKTTGACRIIGQIHHPSEYNGYLIHNLEFIQKADLITSNYVKNNTGNFTDVFPNPTSDILTVKTLTTTKEYIICDLMGRVVLHTKLSTESESLQIEVSGLREGMYILQTKDKTNTIHNTSFIKK